MKPITNNTELIAACGLYCGACRKYLKGKCPGCRTSAATASPPLRHKAPQWCSIRKCCQKRGLSTCADCPIDDVRQCRTYNNLAGRLFGYLFNSDRAACIDYIRRHGKHHYAERMAWDERMTFPRHEP